ncbi:hypothetical protein [Dechloromonas denitrificans]|uniref:hypothetical protein n=1 Tax=Dechloromonas denitrificans TaxID=281362 RepID=UPI001CF90DBB|nr:hypothetical protein [Dechloromonas denitrificans]UCV05700.1 hypothetical protein KI611_10790 [Dechloromonas denitrificans]
MIAWRKLPAWLLRAWPLLALVPFFAVHAVALNAFQGQATWVHKIIGLSLQLLGGLLVLWSVNDNLGLFRKTSLAGTFMAWLRDFPTTNHHLILATNGMANASGSAAVVSVGRKTPTSLEERVAELELLLQELRAELSTKITNLAMRVEASKTELSDLIQATDGKIASLSERVEKVTIGGFKVQAFGVLLAIYGAITSVLA